MNPRHNSPTHLRLADLLAALSVETDLAMGHPPEEAMRTCLVATGLARGIVCGSARGRRSTRRSARSRRHNLIHKFTRSIG